MEREGTVRTRSSLSLALLLMLALLAMTLGLVGCSSEEELEPQSVSEDVITIEVPGSWTVEEADISEYSDLLSGYVYSAVSDDGSCSVVIGSYVGALDGTCTADELTYSIASELESSDGGFTVDEDSLEETTTSDGVVTHTMGVAYIDDAGTGWEGSFVIYYSGEDVAEILALCEQEEVEEHLSDIEDVIDSAVIADASEPLFFDEEAYEEELAEELEEDLADAEEDLEDAEDSSDSEVLTDGQIGDGEYTLSLPGSWYVEDSAYDDETYDLSVYVAFSSDFTEYLIFYPSMPTVDLGVTSMEQFETAFLESMEYDAGECTESTTSDGVVNHRYSSTDEDGITTYINFTYSGDTCGIIFASGYDDEALADVSSIIDGITVANPSAPSIS